MSGIYIRVTEERVIDGTRNDKPEIERNAFVRRKRHGETQFRIYERISEASIFRLVRMQDKLAEAQK